MPLELGVVAWVFTGAAVQGMSGLGFSLVAAPSLVRIIPGTSAIGTVNALAAIQNTIILWRSPGRIQRGVIAAMLPGLAAGTVAGVALGWLLVEDARPLAVALSSLLSVGYLIGGHRVSPRFASLALPFWGAAVNSFAGVGGPPLSSYLIARVADPRDYIRTQQAVFLGLNLASLPAIGMAVPSVASGVAVVASLFVGSLVGLSLRGRLTPGQAKRVGVVAIVGVAAYSLVVAVVQLAVSG